MLVQRAAQARCAAAAGKAAGRKPPRRSCTVGAAPASSALTITWTPATWSAGAPAATGRAAEAGRSAVAQAGPRQWAARRSGAIGRSGVATGTPVPGSASAAICGSGASSASGTAGPPSSALASAATSRSTAGGDPSSRTIRTIRTQSCAFLVAPRPPATVLPTGYCGRRAHHEIVTDTGGSRGGAPWSRPRSGTGTTVSTWKGWRWPTSTRARRDRCPAARQPVVVLPVAERHPVPHRPRPVHRSGPDRHG